MLSALSARIPQTPAPPSPTLFSHIPNLESLLQDLYTRSTGLSVEPSSGQFSILSQAVSVLARRVGAPAPFTPGSILFAGPDGTVSQDNANFFWDSANRRMGLGTATPSPYGLHIIGTHPSGIARFEHAPDTGVPASVDIIGPGAGLSPLARLRFGGPSGINGTITYDNSTGSMTLDPGFNNLLVLKNSGNVGIGTAGPAYSLDVNGVIRGRSDLFLTKGGSPFIGATDNFDLRLGVNTAEYMRITTAGNVGIGLASPTAVLHFKAGVAGANGAPLKFTAGTLLTTPELGAMEFTDDGTTGHLYVTRNVGGVVTRTQIV